MFPNFDCHCHVWQPPQFHFTSTYLLLAFIGNFFTYHKWGDKNVLSINICTRNYIIDMSSSLKKIIKYVIHRTILTLPIDDYIKPNDNATYKYFRRWTKTFIRMIEFGWGARVHFCAWERGHDKEISWFFSLWEMNRGTCSLRKW